MIRLLLLALLATGLPAFAQPTPEAATELATEAEPSAEAEPSRDTTPAAEPATEAEPSAEAEPSRDTTPAAEPAADFPAEGEPVVIHGRLDDVMINRGTAAFLADLVAEGEADPQVVAVVVQLDTPGGSLDSTRDMAKVLLAAEVPVVFWVGPPGARAASAGVFLTVAAHVAAMAPATHIGAAHPVLLKPPVGGGDKTEEEVEKARDTEAAMLEKITNDTVAWGRNLADIRGRNADWVESAVRDSVSIGVDEAVELGVVDFAAEDLEALVAALDGRTVELPSGPRTLRTAGATVRELSMTPGQAMLLLLANPSISFMLLLAGLGLLWLEFQNPGLVAPAVAGGLCLLLFAFSLSAIPVNLLAMVFILLGFGLLVAEIYVPSLGLLTLGGVVSIAFGGLFLVDRSPEFPVGVSPVVIVAVSVLIALLALLIGRLLLVDRARPVLGGQRGMLGERGEALQPIPGGRGTGQILVHGERWSARSTEPIEAGDAVQVQAIDGLVLDVIKI